MTDRQDFNYVKAPLHHQVSFSDPYSRTYNDPFQNSKDPADHMPSAILLDKKREEVMIIDQSLGRDYLWYLIWFFIELVLSIAWMIYAFVWELRKFGDWTVIISVCVTVLLLVGLSYGALAFFTKDSKRQNKFTKLLRGLIFVCLADIPVLVFAESPVLFNGRILGTVISLAVFYTARNLDLVFEKRTKLIQDTSIVTEV